MPKVYHYSDAGIFVAESDAIESPLEPGIFLTPGNATTIAPPTIPDGQEAVFANGVWTLQEIPAASEPTEPTLEAVQFSLLSQIAALEYKQARPLREMTIAQAKNPVDTATVTASMARITEIDTQIAALRAQLPSTTTTAS